jgi:short-subunit dehydrogenase involved in D-alanine esterification of teichoic acids
LASLDIDLKKGYDELKSGEDESAINFVAMMELTALFIGHLIKKTVSRSH